LELVAFFRPGAILEEIAKKCLTLKWMECYRM